MAKHHRKAPLFGIPEHPAGAFVAHSANLSAIVNHDLNKVAHHHSGVTEKILHHHNLLHKSHHRPHR